MIWLDWPPLASFGALDYRSPSREQLKVSPTDGTREPPCWEGGAQQVQDRRVIQAYINNFRRHIARSLKPQVGLGTNIHPAKGQGAILEFRLSANIPNEDNYLPPEETVNDALRKLDQHAFGGNLSGFSFEGTNIIVENDRLILIKGGDSPSEWNDQAAASDVQRVLSPGRSQ